MTMAHTLTIRDEPFTDERPRETVLEFLTERITVRELIRGRVYQEVQDYNLKQPEYFRGLVAPSESERTLNGFRLKKGRAIDWRRQFDAAVAAFERRHFLILVDDRQVESLDDEITIGPGTAVSFVKLVLLVGG
jgi:hypothetical protein